MRQPLNGTASPLAGGGFGGYKTGSSGGSWAAHAVQAVGRLQEFVARFRSGENLTRSETGDFLACILDESAPDALIAACLVAFAEKGETVEELVGLVESLRNRMVLLPAVRFDCVDTAGMGASSAKTFNVSTAAAIVAAAAGVPIAKHGNGAASSKSGSADVMRALGAHLPVAPQASAQMLSSLGFCFLFAPLHHPALARLAGIRRKLAIRTCFNLAGPLANPAGATRHLLGVSHAGLLPLMADALAELHATHAWVVHGCDGLDEITLSGPTQVAELRDGRRSDF